MARKPKVEQKVEQPKRCKWLDERSYTGPVLHDRWQVTELGYGLDCYTLWDRKKLILTRDDKGQTMHFSSIAAAEAHADVLAGVKPSRKQLKVQKAAAPKVQKVSAASMFRDLILDGQLSDDEIFAKVKAQFNLPDSRRGYVDWYRKDLKKKGLLVN